MIRTDRAPVMQAPSEHAHLVWGGEAVGTDAFLEKYQTLGSRRVASSDRSPLFTISERNPRIPLSVRPFQQYQAHTHRNVTVLPQYATVHAPVAEYLTNVINAQTRHSPIRETLGQTMFGIAHMLVRADFCLDNKKGYPPDHKLTSQELSELFVAYHEGDDQPAYGGVQQSYNLRAYTGRARFASQMASLGRPLRLAVFTDNYALHAKGLYSFDDDQHTKIWSLDESLDEVSLTVRARRWERGAHGFLRPLDPSNINTGSELRDYKGTGAVDDRYLNHGMILEDPETVEEALQKILAAGLPPAYVKDLFVARKEGGYAAQAERDRRRGESSIGKIVYELEHAQEDGRLVRMPGYLQQRSLPLTAANLGISFADIDMQTLIDHFFMTPDGRDYTTGDKIFAPPPIPGNEQYYFAEFRGDFIYFPHDNILSSQPVLTPTGGFIELNPNPFGIHGSQNSLKVPFIYEGASFQDFQEFEPKRQGTIFSVNFDPEHHSAAKEPGVESNQEIISGSSWKDILKLHPVTIMRRYTLSRQLQESEYNDFEFEHHYMNHAVNEKVFKELALRHGAPDRSDDMEFLFTSMVKDMDLLSDAPPTQAAWQSYLHKRLGQINEFQEWYESKKAEFIDTFPQWYDSKKDEARRKVLADSEALFQAGRIKKVLTQADPKFEKFVEDEMRRRGLAREKQAFEAELRRRGLNTEKNAFETWYEQKRKTLEETTGVATRYIAPVELFTNGAFTKDTDTWYSIDALSNTLSEAMKAQLRTEDKELIARLREMPKEHPEEAVDLYRAFATNHYWGCREMIAELIPELVGIEPKIASMLLARLTRDQREEVRIAAQVAVTRATKNNLFVPLTQEDISIDSLRQMLTKDAEPLADKWVSIYDLPSLFTQRLLARWDSAGVDEHDQKARDMFLAKNSAYPQDIFPANELLYPDEYYSETDRIFVSRGSNDFLNYDKLTIKDPIDYDYARVDLYPSIQTLTDESGTKLEAVNISDIYRRLKASNCNPRAWLVRTPSIWHYDRFVPEAETLVKALVDLVNNQLPDAKPLILPEAA
jgi:hypothetical protein